MRTEKNKETIEEKVPTTTSDTPVSNTIDVEALVNRIKKELAGQRKRG